MSDDKTKYRGKRGFRLVNLYGSDLKRYILEHRIDKINKKIRPVRVFLKEYGTKIGLDSKPSNYTYWCKNPEVVNSEPYKGEPITQRLIERYAYEMGYFEESMELLKGIGEKLGLDTDILGDTVDFDIYKKLIIEIFGENKYKQVKKEVQKEMNKNGNN